MLQDTNRYIDYSVRCWPYDLKEVIKQHRLLPNETALDAKLHRGLCAHY